MFTKTGYNAITPGCLKSWWQRFAAPARQHLQNIMTSGMTPRKLALTLCLGVSLGTMPLIWGTSLLCILLAHTFRLNHLALQSLNYILYPLQLALLLPFYKLGTRLFPWGPPLPEQMLSSLLSSPGLSSLHVLGWVLIKSLAAWLITVLPVALLAYGLLLTAASRKCSRSTPA